MFYGPDADYNMVVFPVSPREVGCHYDGGNEFTGLSDCIGGNSHDAFSDPF